MWAGCPLWARHCPGVCVTVTGLPRTACQAQGRSCILLASAVGARLVCEAPAGHWRCSRESLNLGLPTQRMGIGLQTKSPPGCDCPVGSAPPSMSSSALRPPHRSLWRTPREESPQLPAWPVQGPGQQQGWPRALWYLCPLTSLETDVVCVSHQGSLPPLPSRMPTQHQASQPASGLRVSCVASLSLSTLVVPPSTKGSPVGWGAPGQV